LERERVMTGQLKSSKEEKYNATSSGRSSNNFLDDRRSNSRDNSSKDRDN